ncbi:LLM class flavin-dependent oxidoreductase [Streptomyces argyrophyllae]|uniref:LLM class flavin-dependent oxidoreductase n=1 Tax=Streptomyces argyrophylli TaxID=2726118 RepID=A0A6M4PPA7_9ACTN|nr:LLM class flavin-dependent oxidoreductase [Streptomyces argyrophyllae]QJS10790.1 LLM class flavin-dependent oxidoreductase [Streptomyces argyrophyllae]
MITIGLALPHYDGFFPNPGVTGAHRTRRALAYAQRAEQAGLHQLWVSDHLWLDVAPQDRRRSPDCWTLLAAIAATTRRIRLGSLVTPASLREPELLVHQITTVADLAGERLDIGLGAGWNAAEFAAAGRRFSAAADRLADVERTAELIRTELGPTAPPVWVGGKRSGILSVAARIADGWNLAWDPTPASYWQRLARLNAAQPSARKSAPILRSVGLTTVIGTDEADLHQRWTRLRRWVPGGHLDGLSFDAWRKRGLIGTPDEVHSRLTAWESLGVDHVVCALGMPFGLFDDEQIDLLAAAARRAGATTTAKPLTQEERYGTA